MTKYYHRGSGEAVIPGMNKPIRKDAEYYQGREEEFDKICKQFDAFNEHLASLPVSAYCDPSLPVDWLKNVEEKYEVKTSGFKPEHEWFQVSIEAFELEEYKKQERRIFLSKSEPAVKEEEKDSVYPAIPENISVFIDRHIVNNEQLDSKALRIGMLAMYWHLKK